MDKNPYSHFERHSELRREISQKSHSLLNVVQRIKHNKWDVQIKGIDAASNEMSAGPEVFHRPLDICVIIGREMKILG